MLHILLDSDIAMADKITSLEKYIRPMIEKDKKHTNKEIKQRKKKKTISGTVGCSEKDKVVIWREDAIVFRIVDRNLPEELIFNLKLIDEKEAAM